MALLFNKLDQFALKKSVDFFSLRTIVLVHGNEDKIH